LPERDALARVRDALVDAVLRGADARRRLADAVLVTKVCATRGLASSPSIEPAGTRTFSSVTSAWSLGMLNVHHMNSTQKPFEATGTMKHVIPRASPGLPLVRAKIRS
jgi:hypothetical protein